MRDGNRFGTWVFIAPVQGLELTGRVGYEFKLDRVTFVAAQKLPYIRKRLGFPRPVSKIRKGFPVLMDRFFAASDTFATMRLTGKGDDQRTMFLTHVRDELAILALSQLGYDRRRHNASPVLADERSTGSFRYLMVNSGDESWTLGGERTGKFSDLRLDKPWLRFQRESFFLDLVRVITKQVGVSNSWVRDIRTASILAGQSQASSDLPQAFLWNMIAIELLLTSQGDRYLESLPQRAEAFIGWTSNWSLDNYEERIQLLYRKRSAFVHTGRRDQIAIDDLLFSDLILLNVLLNIVKHPKLFGSKEDLIEFSEKIQAERLLGVKTKVTPRTFKFLNPRYNEEDYKGI